MTRQQHRVRGKLAPDAEVREARVERLIALQRTEGALPESTGDGFRKWTELFQRPGAYTPEVEAAIEEAAGWKQRETGSE